MTRLALLIISALVLTGCHPRGPSARDVLVVGCSIDAVSMDPAVAYEFVSTNIDLNMYDTLIRYDNNDFTRPLPHIAEKWDISPDGLRYVFHIRKGVKFASGATLDASAVKFSLDRTLTMKFAPAELISDNLAPERIKVLDPYTVEMRLPHPSSYFLCTLYNPAAAIVDPTVVGQHPPEWMLDHSAGSGPYVLVSWERDTAMVLERNENYWGPKPKLRRIIVKDVRESITQRMLLEHGDIDIAYDLNPREVTEAMQASPRVRAIEGPFLRLFYVGMNVKKKPFDDPRVRTAIRMAIDYDGLIKRMADGHAIPLQGPIIKGLLGYAPDLGTVRYDPQKARALLAEAGYPSGFATTIYGSTGSTTFGPSRDDICTKLQADLRAVGINAEVRMLSSTAYLDLFRGKKTELNMGDWGADYPDSFNFAQPFGATDGALAKRVEFSDPSLDPIIEAAGRELDAAKRRRLYVQFQKRLMQVGPWAILLQPTRVVPIRAEVHDYKYNAMSPMDYAAVWKGEP